MNILKRYEDKVRQQTEQADKAMGDQQTGQTGQAGQTYQTYQTGQTKRADQTEQEAKTGNASRQCMLCKRCEAALRSANYRLTRIRSDKVSRIHSCAMCHERVYCLEYDVSNSPTRKK